MKRIIARASALFMVGSFVPVALVAHQLDSGTAGFWESMLHPFTSPDHFVALVAMVFLWAAYPLGRTLRGRKLKRAPSPPGPGVRART